MDRFVDRPYRDKKVRKEREALAEKIRRLTKEMNERRKKLTEEREDVIAPPSFSKLGEELADKKALDE